MSEEYFPCCPVCNREWDDIHLGNSKLPISTYTTCICGVCPINGYSFAPDRSEVIVICRRFSEVDIYWDRGMRCCAILDKIDYVYPKGKPMITFPIDKVPFDISEEKLQSLLAFL